MRLEATERGPALLQVKFIHKVKERTSSEQLFMQHMGVNGGR